MRHIQKLTLNKSSPSHRSLCPNYYVPTSYVEVKKFKTNLTWDSSKNSKTVRVVLQYAYFLLHKSFY